MKAFFYRIYKTKGIPALAMAMVMSLSTTTVFAASPAALSAEAQGVQVAKTEPIAEEVVQPLQKLTEEEAIAKAKKNSADLRAIQGTIDFLYETKGDLWDKGFYTTPSYEHQKWANDALYAVNTALFQTNASLEQSSLGRELTELGLEVTVKSYFTSIHGDLDNLKLLQASLELQEKQYEQAELKYKLGMMSKYNLEQQEKALQQSRDSITQLENALEQKYMKLNDLMGEKSDVRFEYVYDATFTPYMMSQTMEQYITDKTKNEPNIKILESQLETAKFNKNYLAESTTSSTMNQNDYAYDNAQRDLKTARTAMELAIKSTYLQIQQLETSYETALIDLEKAQADYRTVQVNYQAGNVTKLTVEQAKLGVLQAELALQGIAYNHDMLIFSFEHPALLSSGN